VGRDVGPILAALGAGTASAFSPYAARGLSVGSNVLGQFAENRQRREYQQRVQEALLEERQREAEERRRKAEIESQTIDFVTENTEYGEPGQPFRPPAAGIGRGIPEQQARLLKLSTVARGAGPTLDEIGKFLGQRGEEAAMPTMAEVLARGRPPVGVSQSFKAREGTVSVSGPEEYKPPAERAPTIRSEYGRESRIDPETGQVLWSRPTREAPREPKEPPESKKLTRLQRDEVNDEITAFKDKIEAIRSDENLTDVQMTTRIRPLVAAINRKYQLLGEPRQLRIEGGASRTAAPAARPPAPGQKPLKGKAAADAFLANYGAQ
jgi:hypothetical protein